MTHVSRGFRGKRKAERDHSRVPPDQYLVEDFPVLSAGPTPYTPLERWTLSITGGVSEPKAWNWGEFRALPSEPIRADIHCVTKWSKLGTSWEGVSIDVLLEEVGFVGHQGHEQACKAYCFVAQLLTDEVGAGRRRVTLGKDEVDDREHG